MTLHQILHKYWGYQQFRTLQQEIIQSIIDGNDTLALLPTGGGKSICYQVPAMAMEGLCIVVTPLIALMQDQVQALTAKDIPALMLNSTMTYKQVDNVLKLAINGTYKFLYVSPERLETKHFLEYLPAMQLSLIAVDEAHCISQWGYDFRPPYLRIATIRNNNNPVPIIAVTASATSIVQQDICDKLAFNNTKVFQKNFERPNLSYTALQAESKINKTITILQSVAGTAIVYCKSRKRTKEISDLLRLQGIEAGYYHAGLLAQERNQKQQLWMQDKVRVMVCTNAFGMGIDKPNVRIVIHYDIPDCIENYYQEAGRAGRDEQKAYAVLLYQKPDLQALLQNVELKFPSFDTIKSIYLSISNYLQLTYGSGEFQSFDFDMNDFCKKFEQPAILTNNVLKILEQEELLTYNESFFTPSTIQFTTSKTGLQQFENDNPNLELLIKTLLRTYGGILDYAVPVSEQNIAFITHDNIPNLVNKLIKIQAHGIISYSPKKEMPQLYFNKERIHSDNFTINTKLYEARKKAYTERVEKIIAYATLEMYCRSKYIATYFAAEAAIRCTICNNCIAVQKLKITNNALQHLATKIIAILSNNTPIAIANIGVSIGVTNIDDINQCLKLLQSEDIIVIKNKMVTLRKD